MLCFGCKQREGGCHIFWFAWYENSGGLQSMEPVVYLGWNEIFYWDVCISMQFASFIVVVPGASSLDFTVNLSWGQYKCWKWIWLFIYMHTNRHTLLGISDDCWNGDSSWLYMCWSLVWRQPIRMITQRKGKHIRGALHVTVTDITIKLPKLIAYITTIIFLYFKFSEMLCLNIQIMHCLINYPLICINYQKKSELK